jgi:hypothetical protein
MAPKTEIKSFPGSERMRVDGAGGILYGAELF